MTRLLPGGLAERISHDPEAFTTTELLTVTVLMSDIRGYTALAEDRAARAAGGAAQRAPSGDERCCAGSWRHRDAVRRRRRDGRLRRARTA